MTEFAWLIEGKGPQYWDGRGTDTAAMTYKHDDAVRFARPQDADRVIHWLLNQEYRAVEHGWEEGKPVNSHSYWQQRAEAAESAVAALEADKAALTTSLKEARDMLDWCGFEDVYDDEIVQSWAEAEARIVATLDAHGTKP